MAIWRDPWSVAKGTGYQLVETAFALAAGGVTGTGPGLGVGWATVPRLELVKDKDTRETFSEDECETLLRGFLSNALFDAGMICRADDRGDPVIQISPPLVAGQAEFDEIVSILGDVLTEASALMR